MITKADLILGFVTWLANHRAMPREQAHSVIASLVDIVNEETEYDDVALADEGLAYLAGLTHERLFERAFARVMEGII